MHLTLFCVVFITALIGISSASLKLLSSDKKVTKADPKKFENLIEGKIKKNSKYAYLYFFEIAFNYENIMQTLGNEKIEILLEILGKNNNIQPYIYSFRQNDKKFRPSDKADALMYVSNEGVSPVINKRSLQIAPDSLSSLAERAKENEFCRKNLKCNLKNELMDKSYDFDQQVIRYFLEWLFDFDDGRRKIEEVGLTRELLKYVLQDHEWHWTLYKNGICNFWSVLPKSDKEVVELIRVSDEASKNNLFFGSGDYSTKLQGNFDMIEKMKPLPKEAREIEIFCNSK